MTKQIRLASRLDSAGAVALAADLAAHADVPVRIDASETELLGAQAQQALASAARTWRRRGLGFTLTGLTPRTEAQIRALGLETLIMAETEEAT